MSRRSGSTSHAHHGVSGGVEEGHGEIIQLADGWLKIRTKGIEPFLELIEDQKRDFFKAKEFIELYDLLFKMCIQRDPYNWSEQLYQYYTQSIRDYLTSSDDRNQQTAVRRLLSAKETGYDAGFLTEWKTRFNNHKLVVAGLKKLFMYLDRFFTPNTDGVLKLDEQGYKLYKELVFDPFVPQARQAILNSIDRERANESQDRHLLQEAVDVFVTMGYSYNNKKLEVYEKDLETYIIDHAQSYYKRESARWLAEDPTPIFLEKAEEKLAAEKSRVDAYLNRNTADKLQRACYHVILKQHQRELLSKKTGLDHLLHSNAKDDLSRLYRLYKYDPADLEPIAQQFQEHVKNVGADVVQKSQAPAAGPAAATSSAAAGGEEKKETAGPSVDANHELVKNLIALHERFNSIVVESFEKAQIMQKSLKKAFEEFINRDNRVSKLLAKFVNDVLKKGTKLNIKDVESTLDNVVFLYGYIQEKDVFERDYQLFLSQRLLNGLCESEHSEKSMIAKLKRECGYMWTNKLEGMFKDVQLSKELMLEFKRHATSDGGIDTDISLDVNVCTTGYWPTSKAIPSLKHPSELGPICDKFKRFYLNRHSGHKLEWRMDQGQAEITVDFNETNPVASRRALVLTTFQMIIMLVFNSFKIVTYRQLLDITGIPPYEIANHLLSLCHPSVKVLLKNPNTKKLEDAHKFKINDEYKNSLKKISIPLLRTAEGGEEKGEEENKIIELQRRHQIDAAVVRIMKSRKRLNHTQLTSEVITQLQARFKPTSNDIKKRIEALIEQDYLERDPNERSTYNYLA